MACVITGLDEKASGIANASALQEAVSRGLAAGETEFLLPAGRYEMETQLGRELFDSLMDGTIPATAYDTWRDRKNILLSFAQTDGLTVDGQGATLVMSGLIQPFSFADCRNVCVRNLCIDWKRTPYSVGTVLASSAAGMEVAVDDIYPIKGGEPVVSYQDFDVTRNRPGGVCEFADIENMRLLRPQTVEMVGPQTEAFHTGDRVILRHIYSYSPVIHLLRCDGVQLEDVTLHAGAGMGVIGHGSRDLTFRRLRVVPSGTRMMSVNCDATHFIGCSGDIRFEDCEFEAMGDDAVNVHGFYLTGEKTLSPGAVQGRLEVTTQDFLAETPAVGDTVEFVHRETLKPYAVGRVAAVEDGDTSAPVLHFANPIPDGFRPGDVIANASRMARLTFARCTVRNIRGRAVLIQSRGARVEDCTFEGCTGQGVHINTAAGWWESAATADIEVRGNRFLDCGYGQTKYCDAVAVVTDTECELPAVGVHRGIRIVDNEIRGGNVGILLRCAADVEVAGNTYDGCSRKVKLEYVDQVRLLDCAAGDVTVGDEVSALSLGMA